MFPLLLCLAVVPSLPQDAGMLTGSTWRATTSQGREFTLSFQKDGVLEYTSPAGTFRNATWTQDGAKVSFEMNKKYAEWSGTISGGEMEGKGTNINGDEWTWRAKRLSTTTAAPETPKPTKPTAPTPTMTRSATPTRPTPPPAAPTRAQPVAPPVDDLTGTLWEGTDSDGDPFSYRFLPNGQLEYRADKSTGRGTWKQNGATVTMETNNRFAEFTVTITGTTMTGKATNVEGRNWTFTARRVSGSTNDSPPRRDEPKPPPKTERPTTDLVGTSWRGTDSDGDEYTLHFKAEGRLEADTPKGPQRKASWKLDGNKIYFEFNSRYSEYRGTLKGDLMEGTAENAKGRTWTWKFRKIGAMTDQPDRPTPPRGDKSEPPANPRVVQLVGTTWSGRDSDGDQYTLRFKAEGVLDVTSTTGAIGDAKWKQDGNKISFEMNSGYSKYQGTLQGDVMEGKAENVKGRTWTWKFRRQTEKEPQPVLYQDEERPRKAADIAGTVWRGRIDGDDYTFRFLRDGTLDYSSPTGRFTNGTWRQNGAKVYMQINKKYSEYWGVIKGDVIEGDAENVRGKTWTWKVTRVKGDGDVAKGDDEAPVEKLLGTEWKGVEHETNDSIVFRFLPNGILEYVTPNGTFRNGTWQQTGAEVYMETNKKYAEYRGTLKGKVFSGNAQNVTGYKWTFRVQKVGPVAGGGGDPKPQASLVGSRWRVTDDNGDVYTFRLLADGEAECTSPAGTYGGGTWKLTGNQFYMQFNDKYAEYRGTLKGDVLDLDIENKAGRKWNWKLRRLKDDDPKPQGSLVGTRWRVTDDNGDVYTFRLLADGEAECTSPAGTYGGGTWKLTGNQFYMQFNDKYAEYRGTLKGDVLDLDIENKAGRKWNWKLRRLKDDDEAPAAPKIKLLGSTWSGTDSDGDRYTFKFLADGVLEWTSPAGTFRDGRWKLTGDKLHITLNDGYSTYTGTVKENRMSGDAVNRVGRTWTWKMTRQEDE